MSIENVKYLCIGRINDQKILVDYIPDKRTVAFREDFNKQTLESLKEYNLQNISGSIINSTIYGKWHSDADPNGLVFFVMTNSNYSEIVAKRLLQDLRRNFYAIYKELYSNPMGNVLFNPEKHFMQQIALKYNNPKSIENMEKALQSIETTTGVMKGNIDQIVGNTDTMKNMEYQSFDIATSAENFNNRSRHLQNQMKWRKYRVYAIGFIIAIAIGILLYFIFK